MNISPGCHDSGEYRIKITATDSDGAEDVQFVTLVVNDNGLFTFNRGIYTDIYSAFNTPLLKSLVLSARLKFIESDACLGLEVKTPDNLSENSKVVNINYLDSNDLRDEKVELELVTTFNPEFLTYRGNNVIRQENMSELTEYMPSRWASEPYNSFRVVIQVYLRDLQINLQIVQIQI